jgi:TolA-binding protein
LLGNLYGADGDLPRAERSLSQAYELEPELPDLSRDLGDVLKRLGYRAFLAGDRDAARPYFERLLAMRPPGIKLTAISALLNGDVDAASRESAPGDAIVSETERERLKQEARTAYERAMELLASGDDAGAETQLRASLAALPANPYAHFELGKLQKRRGDATTALTSLRESYTLMRELRIEIAAAYVELADSLLAAGQRDEARTMLDLYLQRFPDGKDHARAEQLREQAK